MMRVGHSLAADEVIGPDTSLSTVELEGRGLRRDRSRSRGLRAVPMLARRLIRGSACGARESRLGFSSLR